MEECNVIDNIGMVCGNYREYFFDYDYYSQLPNEMKMKEFQIGDVKVSIGKPSKKILEVFDVEYEICETIKLYGVTDENYEDILEQAFFYITCRNLPLYKNEYPKILDISDPCGAYDKMETIFDETILADSDCLQKLSNSEAIAFYNYGVSCRNSESAFIYFYKVLEYFFIINQEKTFKELIDAYNVDGKLTHFIKKVSKIYKTSEQNQLILLLQGLDENITEILNRAEKLELFEKEQCNSSKDKINRFGKALYEYRCSVVHGKAGFEEPIQLRFRFRMNVINKWIRITKDLAEVVIMKFCITQNN